MDAAERDDAGGDRGGGRVSRVGGAYGGDAAYASKAGDHYVRGASAKAEALGLLFFIKTKRVMY